MKLGYHFGARCHSRPRHFALSWVAMVAALLVLIVSVWTPHHLATHDHHSATPLHAIAERLAHDQHHAHNCHEDHSTGHRRHAPEHDHLPHLDADHLAFWMAYAAVPPDPPRIDQTQFVGWNEVNEMAPIQREITKRGRGPPPSLA